MKKLSMRVASISACSRFGKCAAQAVAAAWVILALGGARVEAQGVAPPRLVSWWQAERNGADAQSASPGALVGPVAFVPGLLTLDFSGFLRPLEDPPAVNLVKAGQSVPVKFSLGVDRGLDTFVPGYPRSEQIACVSGAEVNGVDATASASASSLSYDAATDEYTYSWKTAKAWTNTCRQLVVRLLDGSVHRANFTFK